MQGILSHPAVQGGLAPFVVALIVAELLQRLRLSGLAIVAGFAVTVYLVSDFSIEPLTAVRKMVLLGLLAAPLALVLIRSNWPPLRWILTVLGGVAGAWVVSHILQQQDLSHALLLGSGCAVYVGWQIFWMDTLRDSPARAGSAGMALGLGTGGSALLGASALLAQLSLSLAAAAGAYLLLQAVANSRLPCGRIFTLPLATIAGVSGCLAVLTAQLPWYVLPVLGAIPLLAKIPVSNQMGLRSQSFVLSLLTMGCAAGAIYMAWSAVGAPPL